MMQTQIKLFKKRLLAIGFHKKTDRVFYYDNNGLFYVVSFKVKNKEIVKIGLEVSHKGLFDDGIPKPNASPIGGWLGRWGLCDGFSVHGENDGSLRHLAKVLNADFLERVTRDFFSYFKTAADWKIAAQKWQDNACGWSKDWPAKIDGKHFLENPIPNTVGDGAVTWFVNQTANEIETPDFVQRVHSLLAHHAQRLGFYLRDKLFLVRRRGKLYDCISLAFDDLGYFCSVRPFIWSNRFNAYCLVFEECPYTNYNVELLSDAVWIRTSSLIDNVPYLEELIGKADIFLQQFHTEKDWLDFLGQDLQSHPYGHVIASLKKNLLQE